MSLTDKLLPEVNDFLQHIGVEYAICGGHAIDIFVGHQTRPHKDLDVVVYWDDRDKIVEYMLSSEWIVFEPVGTEYLHRITSVSNQRRIKSNIWCLLPGNQHYQLTEHNNDMFAVEQDGAEQLELDYIEFLFNHQENGCFLYARNHSVSREMDKAVLQKGGIPYLAPEIVLLYKSTALDNSDYLHDFDVASPMLSEDSAKWLWNALKTMNPNGHIWLERLNSL